MKNLKLLFLVALLIAFKTVVHAQLLTVEQVKGNTYAIAVNSYTPKSKIQWNKTADTWKNAESIKLQSSSETVELASAHPIFKLESEKTKGFYVAPRGIKLEGAHNFRDMGGYPTKNGKQVKWGKIYRSADISKLTDADVEIMSDLNIKMVCDLRGDKEVELAPDRLPEGTKRVHLPAGSENTGGANSYAKYMKNPNSADSLLKSFYGRTDHLGKKYKPMFDELFALKPDHALLFHCTAGKDRTGVGAALILFALGVDEASIYQDYEATNEFRKQYNEEFIAKLKDQGLSEPAAKSMMAANPEYLRAAIDAIVAKYGSMDSFLEKEMGLTASKRSTLQSKFLY
jgi:protein-tyrosine phosphatase